MLWEKLTREEISQWKEAFKEFDIDGDGTISGKELGNYIGKLGEKFSEEEINEPGKSRLMQSCTILHNTPTTHYLKFKGILTNMGLQTLTGVLSNTFS